FDLDQWLDLDIGAYGTDDSVRPNLVAIAQQRAHDRHGHTYTRDTTIVIGDTTSDVEAALKGGAQIIAVASGRTTADQLREAGARTVLPDLATLRAMMRESE